MKRLSMVLILILLPAIAGPSFAALVQQNYGFQTLTRDTQTGLYWLWDLSLFVEQTYDQQQAGIAGVDLSAYGFAPFHMATAAEMAALWNYSAEEIIAGFGKSAESDSYRYYYGRYNASPNGLPDNHYFGFVYLDKEDGQAGKRELTYQHLMDTEVHSLVGVMAVTTFNPTAAPLPGALILLASGVLGVAGLRRRSEE